MSDPKIICYWNANDREYGHHTTYDLMEDGPGAVFEIEHVAVVKRTFEAWLPPAEDAGSDNFEIVADTKEECQRLLDAEVSRRAALEEASGSDTPEKSND